MQTSALSLQQILAVASSSQDRNALFLDVLADHLSLQGSDTRVQVISILLTKFAETREDIAKLPLDAAMQQHLQKQLRPFSAIENLQHVHMNIDTAKKHFLKGDNLVGLMNIHLALTGHVSRSNVERIEAETLAEKFRSIAERIELEDLPENLKRSFLKRTLKMASILDHYYAFGPEDLQEELEGLVGAMVVSPPPKGSTIAKLYKELATLAVAGLVILTTVDASLGKVVSIMENATKLIEYVDEAGEDEDGQEPEVDAVQVAAD